MSEWKELKLGDVINLKRGYDLPRQARKDGSIPIFSSSGISGFHNEAKANPPGVVTGRYGTIGQVFLAKTAFWPHNTTLYVEDFKGNDEVFIYYFLRQLNWEQFNDKSAVPGVNRNDAHQADVLLPPLPEQRAIASILSALDDKIDLLHRQNRTLESLAQVLFRHWFIDGAGVDWEEGVIPDEFDFTMGLSPAGSSYNEDAIGTPMFQGNADFGFRFPSNRVYTTDPKRFAERFDTLISVRAPVGAQNMAYDKCCIGRGVAAFRHKRNPEYYTYTYFKFHSLMDEIKQFNDAGTVFGSIGKRDFMEFKIVIPPTDRIRQFQEMAQPIDDKVIANCDAIRTLASLRDSLLPKLMSGEVWVQV